MLCCLTKHFSSYSSVLVIYRTVKKQLPRHFMDHIFSRHNVVKLCEPYWSNNNLHQWMVWPCCSYSILSYGSKNLNAHSRTSSIRRWEGKSTHSVYGRSQLHWRMSEGIPYFRCSILYLAKKAAKLKNTFNYGLLSFRTHSARLRSTTDSKGFVSSW